MTQELAPNARPAKPVRVPPPVPSPLGSWGTTGTPRAICPDLLRLGDLGEADSWRGHLVRGIFHVLRIMTGV